nr:cytochrome P450 CYP749A22-like [Ipomoea batatas]
MVPFVVDNAMRSQGNQSRFYKFIYGNTKEDMAPRHGCKCGRDVGEMKTMNKRGEGDCRSGDRHPSFLGQSTINPEIWAKMPTFVQPGDWAEGDANATKNNNMAYFTFGTGPRKCVWLEFFTNNLKVKIALTMISNATHSVLSPNYVPLAPSMVLSSSPSNMS